MSTKDTIRLELTDMAHGGSALGRHEGKIIFVDGGLPGETVQAAIVKDHKHYAQARVAEVITPVQDRIAEPRCPHFGDPEARFSVQGLADADRFCGGCQWQHADYEAQLRYKQAVLVDQLQRIGRIDEPVVRPTLGMDNPWHYRNNAQLRMTPDGAFGFVGIDGRTVVDIDVCYIIHPLLVELFEELELDFPALERVTLRAGTNTGDQMVVLETADDEPPAIEMDIGGSCVLQLSDGPAVSLAGDTYIEEELLGHWFRVSAGSFFQVNTEMAATLVQVVRDYLDPRGYEVLWDLYCGVGAFSVCLADAVAEVVGVEENPVALDDAVVNVEGLDNVWFYEGAVGPTLPIIEEQADLVVLDPPRTGVEQEGLETLAGMRTPRIVYVSCDPATLARDIRRLCEADYDLVEVQPVDLFPQTYHIEAVALLQLAG